MHDNNSSGRKGSPGPDREHDSNESDLRLAKAATKDRAAAEKILVRLEPRVRQSVRLAVGRDQDANDLVNICLLEILKNLGRYLGTGSLEAWAGRLSYRVMMRQLSRRRRRERTEPPVDFETGATEETPEGKASRAHLRKRLAAHFEKLPLERRQTLILRLVQGHSVAEVAQITDVPINTARDRIRVGLRELRKSLNKDPETHDYLLKKSNG